jgi:DNA-binding XRE family transcriptional regulator
MSRATLSKRSHRTAMGGDLVTIRRGEYERLLAKAGEPLPSDDGPPLPAPDANGNFPAVDYLRASIAREVIRRRKAARLSQSELGQLAGVRQETISRLETGKHTVSQAVMSRIESALDRARPRRPSRGRKKAAAAT